MNRKRKQKKKDRVNRTESEAPLTPTTPTMTMTSVNPISLQKLKVTKTEATKSNAEILAPYSNAGNRLSIEKLAKPRQSVAFKRQNRSEMPKPMDDIFHKKDSHAITINDGISYSNPIMQRLQVPSITDHGMYRTNILTKILNQTEPKKSFGAVSARGELKTKMAFPTLNIPSGSE